MQSLYRGNGCRKVERQPGDFAGDEENVEGLEAQAKSQRPIAKS
jgi:hypothetical protein